MFAGSLKGTEEFLTHIREKPDFYVNWGWLMYHF